VNNWIGPVGAYGADLLFQVFGFAAFFCCPWLSWLLAGGGFEAVRSVPKRQPSSDTDSFSYRFLPCWRLCHFPEVRGAIPPGDLRIVDLEQLACRL